jgi:hypothetical protein
MDPTGLRPLGIGEILDVAIKIYRSRFAVLVKATTAVLAPVFALAAIVRISIPSGDSILSTPVEPGTTAEFNGGDFWAFLAGTLVITLLGFVASQVATGASFKAVSGAYLDETPDWRECLQFARSKLGSLMWLSFLLVLFLIPAMLACLVPGIYLYGAWAVAAPVLLLEGVVGRKALKRSRSLVKGRWWPVAGILLLAAILTGIVQAVLLGLTVAVVSVGGNQVAEALANAIGQTTASAITTPFNAAVLTVLYFDLRVRKEGFDLELLARRMGVEAPAATGAGAGPAFLPQAPPEQAADDQPPFWPPPPGWRPGGG